MGADSVALYVRIQANRDYRMFFVIFLLYPLLSRTAFHLYACQSLGEGEQWHKDDMAIDCTSGVHSLFMVIGFVCIVIYPIGIPLVFLFLLWRNENDKAVHPDGTEPTTPKTSAYDFLKKDYKPAYYYFECVTLFEKLLLTGLLIFIKQGSIFQCFAGQCIACTFLAVQLWHMPYVEHTDNILKAVCRH